MLLFCSSAYGDYRYVYCTETSDGEKYYIDTQSIAYTGVPNVVRFWVKIPVTSTNRNLRLSRTKNKERKRMLSKLVEIKQLMEINFVQNTCVIVEEYCYDKKGYVISSLTLPSYGLSSIAPNTVAEALRDSVKLIIQNNTGRSPQQPFIIPNVPQNLTPSQRYSWDKLQEYNIWLVSQPDFPEFNRWYLLECEKAGVTPQQVDAGFYEMAKKNGYNFDVVRVTVDGWYRQFQIERYGK